MRRAALLILAAGSLFAGRAEAGFVSPALDNSGEVAPFADPMLPFSPPPKGWHSAIMGAQAPIYDDEFAQLMKGLLIKDGKSNVVDAKVLFGSCFGGGMLQGLKTELGDTVKWLGASASRFDQMAFGQRTKAENDRKRPMSSDLLVRDRPHGFWMGQLLQQLQANPNQRLVDSVNAAFKADEFGSIKNDPQVIRFFNGSGKIGDTAPTPEVGQAVAGGKGQEINLKDGQSHHAILWAGMPTSQRNINDIEDTRAALVGAWGEPDPQKNPGVTITIHFGIGKDDPRVPKAWKDKGWDIRPATQEALTTTVDELKQKLGPNEQFFFMATDHGSYRQEMMDQPKQMGPGAADDEVLDLSSDALWAMLADPDNVPLLRVEYSGLTGPVPVYFNDVLLGELDPGNALAEFTVPESLIGTSNTVRIVNTSPDAFTLVDKSFDSGAIGDWDVRAQGVPEPSSLVLLSAGAVGLLVVRARRRRGTPCRP